MLCKGSRTRPSSFAYAEKELKIQPDDLVFDLSDGILGDFYPSPSRMQTQFEVILREYIAQIHFRGKCPDGAFDLFATEGAAAAMIYIFKCLRENFILVLGEKMAIITPIFSPYLEIPVLRGTCRDQVAHWEGLICAKLQFQGVALG